MLHVLIHMIAQKGPLTSDTIATMLGTNPVVVRRTMASLRERGYVHSDKGHGGGWTLSARPEDISILDVYEALGEPPIFAFDTGRADASCLVEQGVEAALSKVTEDARELMLSRFSLVTLADLTRDFDRRARRLGLDAKDATIGHHPA